MAIRLTLGCIKWEVDAQREIWNNVTRLGARSDQHFPGRRGQDRKSLGARCFAGLEPGSRVFDDEAYGAMRTSVPLPLHSGIFGARGLRLSLDRHSGVALVGVLRTFGGQTELELWEDTHIS
jgi:hypothetical protein